MSDQALMAAHDTLLTKWSMDPDLYDDKPWYSWATDSLGNVVGDTINFSDDSSDFFYTSAFFIQSDVSVYKNKSLVDKEYFYKMVC